MEKILFVDPDECTGCRVCENVCSLRSVEVSSSTRSRIRVLKWSFKGVNIPVVCQQCENPICEKVCPTKAIPLDPKLGISLVDEEMCVSCRMCMLICPIGAISIDPNLNVAVKCYLCLGDPTCVKYCPTYALQYVEHDRARILKMRKGFRPFSEVLGGVLKGGT